MITAIEKGMLTTAMLGAIWGILYIEQDPRAGFSIAMACVAAMILIIYVDMKIPRRSGNSKRGKNESTTSSYHRRHRNGRPD